MYIDTTQAFRPIIRWDIEWFHRLHFLLDILLYSRFGFVVGALSSLRLSAMLTQITIQSSNTVIWQVTRLHVYYTTNLHVNLWTSHVFNISIFVGRRGFEPRTPASSVQCSTNWAIGPIKLFYKWKAVKPPQLLAGWDSNPRWSITRRVNGPDRSASTATYQFLVTPPGFEPGTHWLKVSYSSQLS